MCIRGGFFVIFTRLCSRLRSWGRPGRKCRVKMTASWSTMRMSKFIQQEPHRTHQSGARTFRFYRLFPLHCLVFSFLLRGTLDFKETLFFITSSVWTWFVFLVLSELSDVSVLVHSDWSDWQAHPVSAVCLFCDHQSETMDQIYTHMKVQQHLLGHTHTLLQNDPFPLLQ